MGSERGAAPRRQVASPVSDRPVTRSQQELERRIFHLKSLFDVSQGLPILRGQEAILKNLLLMVMGMFGSTSGMAFLVEPASGRVEALSTRGLSERAVRGLPGDLAGFFGETAGSGAREVSSGARKLFPGLGLVLWAPFLIEGGVHGGIALGTKLSGEPYSQDDSELLCTLAAQGAVAVENSRLLERMKREEIARVNLMRYLSPHMVEQVLSNALAVNLGGARRTVTVLFADIRNFTALAEALPPEQLVQFLNTYFTSMAACIFEARGTIDKFIGDAVMAVFGSLIPLENTARGAVDAAVLMMNLLASRNADAARQESWLPVEIGIGITTGEVFLGNIGSPERMEYTVIGDTVNIASRLSGIAKPGQILLDRQSLHRLGGGRRHLEHPPVQVKGKAQRVEIFEIVY